MHGKRVSNARVLKVWNESSSARQAAHRLRMKRQTLWSRVRWLESRGVGGIKQLALDEERYDKGEVVVGGVRLNGGLWSDEEIRIIYGWLFMNLEECQGWKYYPQHFRWLLSRNTRERWFKIMEEEELGREVKRVERIARFGREDGRFIKREVS